MQNLLDLDKTILPFTKDDQTQKIRAALERAAGKVYIPAGNYRVGGNILAMVNGKRRSLVGDGIGQTVLTVSGSNGESVITATGAGYDKMLSWVSIDDLEIDAGGAMLPTGIIRLDYAGHIYMSRVLLRNCEGPGIAGYCWWDSTLSQCHVIHCGSVSVGPLPAIALVTGRPIATLGGGALEKCNNIVLDNCRLENCAGVEVWLGQYAARCRIVSSKFDRVAIALDFERTQPNIVLGNQFIASDSATIVRIRDARGIVIQANLFDGHRAIGLEALGDTRDCSVSGNIFGAQHKMAESIRGLSVLRNSVWGNVVGV